MGPFGARAEVFGRALMLAEGAWEVARRQGAMVRPQLRVRRCEVAGGAVAQVRGRERAGFGVRRQV